MSADGTAREKATNRSWGLFVAVLFALLTTTIITFDWWPFVLAAIWVVTHAFVGPKPWISGLINKLFGGPLDQWLLGAVSAGAVAIGLFVFSPEVVNERWQVHFLSSDANGSGSLENWHRGCVAWTLVFLFYQFLRRVKDVQPRWLTSAFVLWVGVLWTVDQLAWLGNNGSAKTYLLVTLGAGGCSFLLDLFLLMNYRDRLERLGEGADEQRRQLQSACDGLSQTVLLADCPVVMACALLVLYLLTQPDAVSAEFVAGVLSFQLLTSKAVFIMIEGDAVEHLAGGRRT